VTPSALILIPCKATMHADLMARMATLAGLLPRANPGLTMAVYLDFSPEPRRDGDNTAWSKVTRVRNRVLDTVDWRRFSHVVWIDADVVDYPADLPTRLISANPDGIAAPMVFVDKGDGTPNYQHFYDTSAYTVGGVHFGMCPPYWPGGEPAERVVDVDSVGCVYSVNTDIYRAGVRHEDHPTNTDHWPVCVKAREMGRRVVVDRSIEVIHARLPDYGEAWH
jgi:hypothetical protein